MKLKDFLTSYKISYRFTSEEQQDKSRLISDILGNTISAGGLALASDIIKYRLAQSNKQYADYELITEALNDAFYMCK